MSGELKDIQGDISASGGITIGVDADIKGSVSVGRDLTVKGWLGLAAKNVGTPCMGLFLTGDDLKKAFPDPRPGWFAIVGNNNPFKLYVALLDGSWHDTGKTVNVELNGDLSNLPGVIPGNVVISNDPSRLRKVEITHEQIRGDGDYDILCIWVG